MSPTKLVEYIVRRRHSDRLMRRLALPDDDDALSWVARAVFVVAALIAVIGWVTK